MVRFEFNGKPFDPQTFEETIIKAAMEGVATRFRHRLSSIRHPETGEFPTVLISATNLLDIRADVEGSPELLALVRSRLEEADAGGPDQLPDAAHPPRPPHAFLSYASEDSDLAGRIARSLQAGGIETFWAEWSIGPGDSLVQKIDEELAGCTHFLVLLTPVSMRKPWVRQEMDAALLRRIADKCVFIALRHDVEARQLPPLLSTFLSPELADVDGDLRQLVNDIHGVSRKPTLGPPPVTTTARSAASGYSAAAMAVVAVFVGRSAHGMWADPQTSLEELADGAGLTHEDAEDALHELSQFIEDHHGTVVPKAELFAAFDALFLAWDPADDALRLAADMLNEPEFPNDPEGISDRYAWPPRRLNPAIAYLSSRGLVDFHQAMGSAPYNCFVVCRNAATRRFVKSRTT